MNLLLWNALILEELKCDRPNYNYSYAKLDMIA